MPALSDTPAPTAASPATRPGQSDEGSDSVSPQDAALQDEALGSATATKTKGNNFGHDEDVNLAGAWLEISQDPVVGDEQKKTGFWSRVHGEFIARMRLSGFDESSIAQRKVGSLQTRWRSLQASCNKFAGCYAAVVARNESGKTVEDKIADAHILFREQNGVAFRNQAVWAILRNSPKWFEAVAAKKNRRKRQGCNGDKSEDDVDVESSGNSGVSHPIGRKAAKTMIESERSLVALVAKLVKETETKNRLLKEATNEQVMARNLEGMTATQRRYYELKQQQILTELQREIGEGDQA